MSPAQSPYLCALLSVVLLSLPCRAEPAATAAGSPKIQQLVKNLGAQEFQVRQQASEGLLQVGIDALAALQEATRSADPEVVHRAWKIIDRWASEGKVPALLFQLSCNSAPIRASAAESLGKMGAAAQRALPALAEASRDRSDLVRCSAQEAIKCIQKVPAVALEVINLTDDNKKGAEVRYQIEVSNGGAVAVTNLRIVALMPEQVSVTAMEGPNPRRDGGRIVSAPLTLEPNSKVRWEIHGKAERKVKDKLTVDLLADQLASPVQGEEGTVTTPAPSAPVENRSDVPAVSNFGREANPAVPQAAPMPNR